MSGNFTWWELVLAMRGPSSDSPPHPPAFWLSAPTDEFVCFPSGSVFMLHMREGMCPVMQLRQGLGVGERDLFFKRLGFHSPYSCASPCAGKRKKFLPKRQWISVNSAVNVLRICERSQFHYCGFSSSSSSSSFPRSPRLWSGAVSEEVVEGMGGEQECRNANGKHLVSISTRSL